MEQQRRASKMTVAVKVVKAVTPFSYSNSLYNVAIALGFYVIIVRFLLVPAMWWSVLTSWQGMQSTQSKSKQHLYTVAVVLLCPHAIASFWLLDAMSYWVNLDPTTILQGRHVFTWSRALQIPRQVCTQVFWKGIGKRSKGERRDVVLTLLIIGHLHLFLCGTSLRGIIGMLVWSFI